MLISRFLKICFLFFVLSFNIQSVMANPVITIAGKTFTEQDILVDLIAVLLKEANPNVVIQKKKNLGGTSVTYEAIKRKEVDIYVEYSGTAYFSILKESKKRNSDDIYRILKQKMSEQGLYWSPPIGFNNTYVLMVKDNEKNKSLKTISDLKPIANNLDMVFDPEVSTRPDGFTNFTKAYDIKFKSTKIINPGLVYQTIDNNRADIIIGYSTDGRIPLTNLKLLKDNLKFFPEYSASVVINQQTLNSEPWIEKALSKIYGHIDDSTMQDLNSKVDYEKQDSVTVAQQFALQQGWVKGVGFADPSDHSLWGFVKQKRKFLFKKIYEHLFITFIAFGLVAFAGVALGVFSYYNSTAQKFIFLIVNLCQTIPSLALFGILIPILGIGLKPSLVALTLYSLLPVVRNTFTGLSEIEPSILETCEILGMNKRQILFKVLLPMSLMTISAGLRTSLVIIVGTTTIASFIGAGGLGDPIFQGITSLNNRLILLGAIPSALLAIFLDVLLHFAAAFLLSPGLKQSDR